jgi:hypothetical protein
MHEIGEWDGEGDELVVSHITHGEGVVRGFGAEAVAFWKLDFGALNCRVWGRESL